MEGERAALNRKIAGLEAEVVRGQEQVSSLEQWSQATSRQLEKAQSSKDEAENTQQRIEAENTHLSEQLAELCLKEKAARQEIQAVEGEREALKSKVVGLEAEVVRGQEQVSSLEQQLSHVRGQQQMVMHWFKASLAVDRIETHCYVATATDQWYIWLLR